MNYFHSLMIIESYKYLLSTYKNAKFSYEIRTRLQHLIVFLYKIDLRKSYTNAEV